MKSADAPFILKRGAHGHRILGAGLDVMVDHGLPAHGEEGLGGTLHGEGTEARALAGAAHQDHRLHRRGTTLHDVLKKKKVQQGKCFLRKTFVFQTDSKVFETKLGEAKHFLVLKNEK